MCTSGRKQGAGRRESWERHRRTSVGGDAERVEAVWSSCGKSRRRVEVRRRAGHASEDRPAGPRRSDRARVQPGSDANGTNLLLPCSRPTEHAMTSGDAIASVLPPSRSSAARPVFGS
ncbi:hypothetical protein PsYK624_131340 [Phanerochaete sordida]|uniref:Uncharacterized protein n=1 Tax=Phanerochaete sordida TaxID=48140 RepID=A0A9P3LIV5_9APHY|nr:hypothetical protein PsYK624_131340 [Phanerochaete sordida]